MKEYKLKTDTEWTQYDPNSQETNFMIETLKLVYGEDAIEIREVASSTPVQIYSEPVITSPRHVVDLTNNVDAELYRQSKEMGNRPTRTTTKQQAQPPPGLTLQEIQSWYYEQARMGRIR